MWAVLVCALAAVAAVATAPCSFCGPYEITAATLPSYVGPAFPFKTYTGYITVNATAQRNIFYWLVESQSAHPEDDPLVFWYQGGPGCSGLLGLFEEHGPFRILEDGSVVLTEFTWNKYANIVYLEQPCGVGFSFSGVPGYKYKTGDQEAANDNFHFVEEFLNVFPQYVGRPTWLNGESYGGVYVPTLSYEILQHPNSQIYKQYAGLMVGNPVLSCASLYERDILVNHYYWHSLISYSTYSQWVSNNCAAQKNSACTKIYGQVTSEIGQEYQEIQNFSFNGTQPSIDPDDLYQDFIVGNASLEWVLSLVGPEDQLLGDFTVKYLNRADVQAAIHAHIPPDGNIWRECASPLFLLYNRSGASMIPYYSALFSARPDVKVMVYSGDIDMATVPAPQTQLCLAELKSPVKKNWAPWFVNGATAGYVEYFSQYTFATVKGAGHTVPTYQPFSSMFLFSRFVQNGNLDGGQVYFYNSNAQRHIRGRSRQGDVLRRSQDN